MGRLGGWNNFLGHGFYEMQANGRIQKDKNTIPGRLYKLFYDKAAMAADVLLAVSLVITVLSVFIRMNYILSLGSLFVLLFTFHLHYLLNGRVYKYLKSKRTKNPSDMSEEKKVRRMHRGFRETVSI